MLLEASLSIESFSSIFAKYDGVEFGLAGFDIDCLRIALGLVGVWEG